MPLTVILAGTTVLDGILLLLRPTPSLTAGADTSGLLRRIRDLGGTVCDAARGRSDEVPTSPRPPSSLSDQRAALTRMILVADRATGGMVEEERLACLLLLLRDAIEDGDVHTAATAAAAIAARNATYHGPGAAADAPR